MVDIEADLLQRNSCDGVQSALCRLRHGTAQDDVHVGFLSYQQPVDDPLPRVRNEAVLAAVRLVRVVLIGSYAQSTHALQWCDVLYVLR